MADRTLVVAGLGVLGLGAVAASILGCGALALAGAIGGGVAYVSTSAAPPPRYDQVEPALRAEPVSEAAPTAPAPAPTPKAAAAAPRTGEVQLQTAAGVQAFVDGQPATYDVNQGWVVDGLKPGPHRLEVRNILGKTVATEDFTVTAGRRTRFDYKTGGRLAALGEVPVTSRPVAKSAPAPSRPAPASPSPVGSGGLLFEDLPAATRVWVDGREVSSGFGQGAILVEGLPSGAHNLRIEQQGNIIHDGGIDVRSAQTHRCTWGSWTGLSCHFVAPTSVPRAQVVWTSTTPTGQVTSQAHVNVTHSVSAAPPATTAMSEADFGALLRAVQGQTFSDGKLGVLRAATGSNHLTVDQLCRLLDTFTFDDDRVSAVGVVKGRLVDPQNAWRIADHFTFSSNAQRAQALLQ